MIERIASAKINFADIVSAIESKDFRDVYIDDLYINANGTPHVVFSSQGRLYSAILSATESGQISVGIPEIVKVEFNQTTLRAIESDGFYRYVGVVACAAINRVGEIDSTALFADFIAQQETGTPQPKLDVYHSGDALTIGRADAHFIAGPLYIEIGTFDNTPVGRAFAQAVIDNPSSWGFSIAYEASEDPILERIDGTWVPVYRRGTHKFTSLLHEPHAASRMTNINIRSLDVDKLKQALIDVMGEVAGTAQYKDIKLQQRNAEKLAFRGVIGDNDEQSELQQMAELLLPQLKRMLPQQVTTAEIAEIRNMHRNAASVISDLIVKIENLERQMKFGASRIGIDRNRSGDNQQTMYTMADDAANGA